MTHIPHHRTVLAASLLALPIALSPLAAPPAHALFGLGGGFGGIVYDPTNHAENLLTAARSLEQINNQIAQLQNEAQMLVNQARNLASPAAFLARRAAGFGPADATAPRRGAAHRLRCRRDRDRLRGPVRRCRRHGRVRCHDRQCPRALADLRRRIRGRAQGPGRVSLAISRARVRRCRRSSRAARARPEPCRRPRRATSSSRCNPRRSPISPPRSPRRTGRRRSRRPAPRPPRRRRARISTGSSITGRGTARPLSACLGR